jgi:ABC-type antimicrobial peptide transport system permease subunit
MRDLRYAVRQLRKSPGFTLTVIVMLALGIGANAAIFTLANSVLLKSLPVADPMMLVRLGNNNDCCVNEGTTDNGDYSLFSTDTYKDGKELLGRTHVVLMPVGAGIEELQKQYASHLHLLMWIASLVLLIACANIANLLLVRGMGQRAEMSVRTALGATRGRVVRQLLTESVLLAGMGGIAGLAVAYAGARILLMLVFPGAQNVTIDASPSLTIAGLAFGLSLLTGILFGVAPAWMSAQAKPVDALRNGARTTATGASLLQHGLVVLQTALSLVLLVGVGLFSQSLGKLQNTDLKLEAKNRYIMHINPQAAGYTQTQIADRFTEQRMVARLTMLFGALALLLATIGLYSATAYNAARRTSEIGIRMALGAKRGSVTGMVMRGAIIQTVLGLAIGIPVALLFVRFVKAQLYEIAGADASVMAGAIVALAAACVAGIIPARRGASIEPMQALRNE